MITKKKLIRKFKDSIIVFSSILFHVLIILILTLFILKKPVIQEDAILDTSNFDAGNDIGDGFDIEKNLNTDEENTDNDIDDSINVEAVAVDQVDDNQKSIPLDMTSVDQIDYQVSEVSFGSYSSVGIKNNKLASRFGSNKHKALLRNGGSKKTEEAVSAGIKWLIRHQEKDGHWNTLKYTEKKSFHPSFWDPGVTALALLAILGAGNTDRTGPYRNNVKRALAWLESHQDKNGCYANTNSRKYGYWSMYNHAICTMAMAEAYGMNCDKKYKASIKKAIQFISRYKNKKGLWGYQPHDKRYDSSIIGWVTMALKAAKLANIHVSDIHFKNIRKHCFSAPNDVPKNHKMSSFDPTLNYANIQPHAGRRGPAMTGIGMLLLMYTGTRQNSTRLYTGAERLLTATPRWIKNSNKGFVNSTSTYSGTGFNNEYTWYYGTIVMFQMGGKFWKTWNQKMQSALLPNQCTGTLKDGSTKDISGSWPTLDHGFGRYAGRVYMTAIACLNLEVYYRYTKFFKEKSTPRSSSSKF